MEVHLAKLIKISSRKLCCYQSYIIYKKLNNLHKMNIKKYKHFWNYIKIVNKEQNKNNKRREKLKEMRVS